MNERIRELAGYVEKYISTTNFEGMPEDEMTYDEIFQKKFAELLIQECLMQIDDAIPDTNCSAADAYKTAKLAAMSRVKKHFGVE